VGQPKTAQFVKKFRRHVLPALSNDRHAFARLLSTSPAYAGMTLEVKVKAWSIVREALEP
jgi:hypothetical protein